MRSAARPCSTADPLADLTRIVADLEGRVVALEARRTRRDPARDGRLLAATAHAFGGAVFSAKDLHRHAVADRELAAALDGAGTRRIGARLKQLNGRAVGPYRLHRVGRDADGALWSLTVSAHRHTGR